MGKTQTETKHTPGPWYAEQDCRNSIRIGTAANKDIEIATIIRDCGESSPEDWANADLIVLAVNSRDDLLAALKAADYRLTYLLSKQQGQPKEYSITRDALSKIRAAIRKARGES